MTATDRELGGLLREWLSPGSTTLSERVFTGAMAEISTTPQRRGSATAATLAGACPDLPLRPRCQHRRRDRRRRRDRSLPPGTRTKRRTERREPGREPESDRAAIRGSRRIAGRHRSGHPSGDDRRRRRVGDLLRHPPGLVEDGRDGLRPLGRSLSAAATRRGRGELLGGGPGSPASLYMSDWTPGSATGTTPADLAAAFGRASEYDTTAPVDVSLDGHRGKSLRITLPDQLGDCGLPGRALLWESSCAA